MQSSGDLQQDKVRTTLEVFETADVRAALGNRTVRTVIPRLKIDVLGSTTGTSGLVGPRWDGDRGVLFLGTNNSGKRDVYRLDIASGRVANLSNTPEGVGHFDYKDGRLLFGRSRAKGITPDEYPVASIRRNKVDGSVATRNNIFQVDSYFSVSEQTGRRDAIGAYEEAAIAPGGSVAAIYSPGTFKIQKFYHDRAPTEVIELPAIHSSIEGRRMFWSGDGSQVILVGVRAAVSEGNEFISVFNMVDGGLRNIYSLDPGDKIKSVVWIERKSTLILSLVKSSGAKEHIQVVRRPKGWEVVTDKNATEASEPTSPLGTLELRIRQGENTPPVLIASEAGREIVLTPPDPALLGVNLIQSQRFRWRDFDGREREGALLLPATYRSGRPVPVVIQPYHFLPQLFLPDGFTRTAFAAQALAARGMAVLTIETSDLMRVPPRVAGGSLSTPMEGPEVVRRIDAVVDALINQGIAEAAPRIGLVGFSRSGYHTYYAISHPARTRLSAAFIADSLDNSFANYLIMGATGVQYSAMTTGAMRRSPWDDPKYWLEHDVSLNADRIATPVLFSRNNVPKVVNEAGEYNPIDIQTMGVFMLNAKPVDYLLFPEAPHQLALPQQRVANIEAVVDWMSFWLLGHEDPDPAKAMQFQRWRKLRTNWITEGARDTPPIEGHFIRTRSGLSYLVRSRKTGREPFVGETVVVHYSLYTDDGKLVASTRHGGAGPITLRLGSTIDAQKLFLIPKWRNRSLAAVGEGLNEGLALLHVGEKATFVMPRELVPQGDRSKIGLSNTARYEVELVSILSEPGVTSRDDALLEMKKDDIGVIGGGYETLDTMGYEELYINRDIRKAVKYFLWNLALFPDQAELYVSLAEAYVQTSDRDLAIKYLSRALHLDSNLQPTIAERIDQLKQDPEFIYDLQIELTKRFQNGGAGGLCVRQPQQSKSTEVRRRHEC
ncbi:FKBP-type peptidyl-prolyl cis-trans isomerase [Sphingorhabdus contaminans]|nr:FKBP-type peptidyl-prolyl cis-trans isomerase [Sphingorhabdus contaminans]